MTAPQNLRESGRGRSPLTSSGIDPLLDAPSLAASHRGVAPRPQIYDFKHPQRVSPDRQRTLEAMYGHLVKSFEGWIMGRVRGVIELRLQSVEQVSFGEFALSMPPTCNAFICDVKATDGEETLGEQAVIDFGRDFAFFLVDRLFGGGANPTVPDRALTPIERMAVRSVAERLIALLAEIWREHVKLELSLAGFESIPEIIKAAPRESPSIVATLEVTFNETTSHISACLPLSVLEPFFVTGANGGVATHLRVDNPVQRQAAETALKATSMTLAARLPDFHLPMRDIAALKVGSMLSTGVPVDAPVRLLVGGHVRFETTPGCVKRRLAVRVLNHVGPPLTSSSDLK